ncbi:Fur family transcriptional regulator [Mucisphaera sp.]|uniref:Fur family transcriptional regulator n=1 Tax=Mucisphaera sp. TaxID=2913024 RepID=UPI003D0C4744
MTARYTHQRSAIVDALHNAGGPLRPLDILRIASKQVPSLGLATVYRHLKQLQASGEIHAVEFCGREVRYESTDRGHHHHFLCRACGEAFDLNGCPEGISKLVPPGFEVSDHELTLLGRCPDCVASNQDES